MFLLHAALLSVFARENAIVVGNTVAPASFFFVDATQHSFAGFGGKARVLGFLVVFPFGIDFSIVSKTYKSTDFLAKPILWA